MVPGPVAFLQMDTRQSTTSNIDAAALGDLRSTRQAAKLLGIRPSALSRAIWEGRLGEPPRSPSGAFLWRWQDLERASWVLLRRDLDDVLAEREQSAAGGRTAP